MHGFLKKSRLLPRWLYAVGATAAGCLMFCPGFAQVSREYDLKAAFLYNFITFTEWPADAFHSSESPYVVGVVGEDPFGSALDEIVNGERIKGRPLVVRRFRRLDDLHNCHILFISSSEARRLPDTLRRLRGRPVLTVSDMPGFTAAGGGIGFTSTTKIGLNINPGALRDANLVVSSKLLRLARLTEAEANP
ncbi:MAG TPA: YfiR family protein [Lacunisphaera sp.]|nr:YfiR family protein [Lacunisphaera sp.]